MAYLTIRRSAEPSALVTIGSRLAPRERKQALCTARQSRTRREKAPHSISTISCRATSRCLSMRSGTTACALRSERDWNNPERPHHPTSALRTSTSGQASSSEQHWLSTASVCTATFPDSRTSSRSGPGKRSSLHRSRKRRECRPGSCDVTVTSLRHLDGQPAELLKERHQLSAQLLVPLLQFSNQAHSPNGKRPTQFGDIERADQCTGERISDAGREAAPATAEAGILAQTKTGQRQDLVA